MFVCAECAVVAGIPEPMALGQAAKDYLAKTVNPTLLKGLTELCKKKPQDPVVSSFTCIYACIYMYM